jgi:uncharacterized protein
MQNNHGLTAQDLEMIDRIFSHESAIKVAILFGSRAKGNFRPGSDVDIALKGQNLDQRVITNMSFLLNEETVMPYQFDILNYRTIQEPALVEHIDRMGVAIYRKSV